VTFGSCHLSTCLSVFSFLAAQLGSKEMRGATCLYTPATRVSLSLSSPPTIVAQLPGCVTQGRPLTSLGFQMVSEVLKLQTTDGHLRGQPMHLEEGWCLGSTESTILVCSGGLMA
jgi:hypothetical protein